MIALLFALFALFCIAAAWWNIERVRNQERAAAWEIEKDAINKVGKWYQDRVAELENESRALAEQVIAGGSVVRHAMPIPQPDGGMVYLTDDTGLVVDAVKASEYHGE